MQENKNKIWVSARALHWAGLLYVFSTAFAWSLCLVAVDIQLRLYKHADKGNFFWNILKIYF